ncbi:MAG: hypothetical protein LBQ31_00650 [Bacteroidales bacterium]|jgi:uncharacterized membrane protein YraQ (UPF0718 family)|nr:hypothetical protein [Bacteroidales bacterium]
MRNFTPMNKQTIFNDLYKMFVDITKYVITGVLISSFFTQIRTTGSMVFVLGAGAILAVITYSIAMCFFMLNKNKKK